MSSNTRHAVHPRERIARPVTIPLEADAGLAARIRELCVDLDYGAAEVLDLVTPTTRELLRGWFGLQAVEARGSLNFSAAQRDAILRVVVAHEVLLTGHLLDIHGQLVAVAPGEGYPRYRLGLPSAGCDVFVLAALLVWQLANRHPAERRQRCDDPRFAARLLVAAPEAATARLLHAALAGPPHAALAGLPHNALSGSHPEAAAGSRMAHSLFQQAGDLLLPGALRTRLLELLARAWSRGELEVFAPPLPEPPHLRAWPQAAAQESGLMVFQPMPHAPGPWRAGPWQPLFDQLAQEQPWKFAQIDLLCQAPARKPEPALSESHPTPA